MDIKAKKILMYAGIAMVCIGVVVGWRILSDTSPFSTSPKADEGLLSNDQDVVAEQSREPIAHEGLELQNCVSDFHYIPSGNESCLVEFMCTETQEKITLEPYEGVKCTFDAETRHTICVDQETYNDCPQLGTWITILKNVCGC